MPWLMKNVYSSETEKQLGDIVVQAAPTPLNHYDRKKGYASPEAKGVTLSTPKWVAGETRNVTLDRGEAARLKWVARATRNPKAVDIVAPDLHFVLATGAANGDRLVATDGHRLHFAPAPPYLTFDPICLHVPRMGDIKAGVISLGIYDGSFREWGYVVARRFATELAIEAGPLQDLCKHGDHVAIVIGENVHVVPAGHLSDALNGLGAAQRIKVCLNKPSQPVGLKMPQRGAVIMPFHPGNGRHPVLSAEPPDDAPTQPCNPIGIVPHVTRSVQNEDGTVTTTTKPALVWAAAWDSLATDPTYKTVKYRDDDNLVAYDTYWL